jgi:RNA polymerase sigma factor (TIGR02999 family)
MTDVSQLLVAIEQGDTASADKLLPLVYEELRNLAAARLANENGGQTLQATALVHEAFLRLVGRDHQQESASEMLWNGRGHFFGAASEAMRRILVENARRKKRVRHGGAIQQQFLQDNDAIAVPVDESQEERLLALDAALSRLLVLHPAIGQLVKLRYFAGLTTEQSAQALKISARTAKRQWAYAKAWLRREIDGQHFVDS